MESPPHPEIAEAYAVVRPGDSVRDRLKRVRRLHDLRPNHPNSSLAIARAAIDAREWQTARNALGGLTRADPSERACLLMAEIEEGEHGDQGRVRSWLRRALDARPDPVWTADGQIFDHWAPVSPISGRVDAFEWRVVADHARLPRAVDVEPKDKPAALAPVAARAEATMPEPAGETKVTPAPLGEGRPDGAAAVKAAPVVQPLPDDPGPLAESDEQRPASVLRPEA